MPPRPLLAALFAAVVVVLPRSQEPTRFHQDHVLGTSFDLAVAAPAARAAVFRDAVLAEVARLEAILSAWNERSPVAALRRGEPVTGAADELLDLLELADDWRRRTQGAFDVRIGGPIAVWAEAAGKGRLPDDAAVAGAVQAMRAAELRIDRTAHTVTPVGGVRPAIDGIGKGFVLDRALAAARKACPDVAGALLDIGGDEVAFGKAGERPWRRASPIRSIRRRTRRCSAS